MKGAKKSLLSMGQKKKRPFPANMFQQSDSGSFFA